MTCTACNTLPPALPASALVRRPYRPLTVCDRLQVARDINAVAERLAALLADGARGFGHAPTQ